MRVAPSALQASRVMIPMVPEPRMQTLCPIVTPPRLAACIPTASGSSIAPSCIVIESGSRKHRSAGWAR